jgi:hypothetical protein
MMQSEENPRKKQPTSIYYILAVLSLIAWLAQGTFLLSIPDQSIRQVSKIIQEMAGEHESTLKDLKRDGLVDIDLEKVESSVYRSVTMRLQIEAVLVVFGIVTSLIVLFSRRLWLLGATIASASYLLFWFNTGLTSRVSLWEAYRAKWMLTEAMGKLETFLLQDVILPTLCVAVIAVASFRVVQGDLSERRKTSAEKGEGRF